MQKVINNYFDRLKLTLDMISREEIMVFAELLENARSTKNTVFVMGNGGSAATASHFVCDFNKGASFGKPERFRVICLNDSMPTLSAYSNDVAYSEVFVEQLKNFLKPGDLVVGISCSGNSENILKAIRFANQNDAVTAGWTGFKGGKLKNLARHAVHVPVDDMQLSEDVHMILNHLFLCLVNRGAHA